MTDQENKQIQTANVTNGRSVDRKLFLDKYVRAQLAKNVNQAGRITPRPSGQPAPISFNQQQIWLHAQMACDVPLYNEAITIYRQGPLDVAVLERCLQEIVRRHEICRTTFDVIENETSQIPHPAPAVFPLQVVDLSRLVEAEREAEAMRLATEDVRRTFDLTTGPLIRALLVSMDDQRHRLYLTFHHLIFDAATAYRVFVPELELLYEAFSAGQPSPLPEPRIQYADFAYWQRKNLSPEVWSDHLAYWQKQLSGELSPCLWPSDRPRPPAETHRGAVERFALPQTLVQRLRAFSKQSGMSVYMTLLGGLVALLHRYTGQSDLIIGSLSAGRNRVELEDVMGYFVTPLALRFDLSADPTFRELLSHVRNVILEGLTHENVPFTEIVKQVRPKHDPSRNPLFQIIISQQPQLHHVASGWELVTEEISNGGSKLDLMIVIDDRGAGISGPITYNPDLFDAATIQLMVGHWQTFLDGACDNPEQRIGELAIPTAAERQQILVDWNRTAAALPKQQILHKYFEDQVGHTPDARAVIFEDCYLSYHDLNHRANQVAHFLKKLGVGPDVLVGLFLERSLEMVIGILGILKAGGAYLPLDPTYPNDRVAFMVEDASPAVLLTHSRLAPALPKNKIKVLCLDTDAAYFEHESAENPEHGPTADSLAYAIYTSGSTGKPKGVLNVHRGIVNRLLWMQAAYQLDGTDRVLQKTPYSFDVSVWEFFWPLMTGACLVVARPEGHQDPSYLINLIIERKITTIHFVPSMLRAFLEAEGVERCSSLRRVICSGEALPFELQNRFFERLGAQLHNLYGPTEAAVDVTHWQCSPNSGSTVVPIGRPIWNTQIYILDKRLQPVPVGIAGELHIGGVGLARGYLNRPELTAQRFIPDPFSHELGARLFKTGDLARFLPDGNIEYLGRMDFQVKIRGQRIELGEIEAVLGGHEAVKQCVVVVREKTLGDQMLVAYFEPRADSAPDASDLRNYLKKDLPDYMLPSAFVLMEKLPLTPNGKIDRKALPAPEGDAYAVREYEAPQGEVETTLAGIWADVLKVERVGRHDHFFELGGHSLLAVKLIERMRRKGLHADLRVLFSTPTLAELAAAVSCQGRLVEVPPNLIPLKCDVITPEMLPLVGLSATEIERIVSSVPGGATNVQDIYPLAPLQEGILFHHLMAVERDPYLLVLLYSFDSRARLDGYLGAFQAVMDRHDILRTAVVWEGLREPVQVVWRKATMPVEEVQFNPAGGDVAEQLRGRFDPRHCRIDLRQAPWIHAYITHDAANERWLLLMLLHQIWADNYTFNVILEEIQAYLLGQADRLPAPLPFRNLVAQARLGVSQEEHEGYFRRMLGDVDVPTAPFGLLDVQGDGSGIEEARLEVDAGLARRLRERARKLGVSAASLFHLAWAQVLARVSGREDVVFGTVLVGRMEGGEGADRVLGLFINTLPVRIRVGEEGVEASARAAHTQLADLLRHEHASLALAQRCSAVPAPAPLFTALLNYRHNSSIAHAPSAEAMRAWEGIQELYGYERTNYPFTLNVDDMGEGFRLTTQVQASIEPLRVCDFMHTALASLVAALETAPGAAVRTLNVLPEVERQQVLYEWNQTKADYTRELCVHHLFESQVERSPDAPAVVFDGQTLTYRELNAHANRLAHHLRKLGIGPGTLAGICMERSLQMVVGVLAVIKAGGAYVPLDPAYPEGRIDYVLNDAGAVILLTEQSLLPALGELFIPVVCLDRDETTIDLESSDRCDGGASSEDLAYVIYTSGSTGKPKGVQIEHRAVVNFLSSMRRRPGIDSHDVMLAVTTLAFDIAGLEIFLPLISGARVVISSRKTAVDGFDLIRTVERHGVSVMQATPATWRLMLEAGWQGSPTLKVLCGGEPLSKDLARQLLPRCRELWNMYGPTETTIWSTCSKVMDADDIHIGRPIDNTDLYILDDQFQLLPIGVPGELFIGGDGLARGYLNRPELTEEKFILHPFKPGARLYRTGDLARYHVDGAIDCLGRLDFQVKIRGFRVELGEIEAQLCTHPDVSQNAVVAREDTPGEKRLVAYVVPRDTTAPDPAELRRHLAEKLPDYMLPAAFVTMRTLPLTPSGKIDRRALPVPDASAVAGRKNAVAPRNPTETQLAAIFAEVLMEKLPLTTNGKIDRKALPAPDKGRIEVKEDRYVAPHDAVEQMLVQVWSKVLRVKRVGLQDNFFELGGHSLLAVRLIVEIETVFQKRLPLATLLQAPTIGELAEVLRKAQWKPSWSSLVPVQPGGSSPPLFFMHSHGGNVLEYFPLANRLDEQQPVYALQARGLDGDIVRGRSVEEMVASYLPEIRSLQREGPYFLGGYCFGGVLAWEAAQQLVAAGEQVALLVMIQTFHPGVCFRPTTTVFHRWWYRAKKRVNLEWENFSIHGKGHIVERCRRAVDIVRARTAITIDDAIGDGHNRRSSLSMPYILERLVIEHNKARDKYVPSCYTGDVLLFRASKQMSGLAADLSLGWKDLVAGKLEICELPGHQEMMLSEPNVTRLADELSARLMVAQQRLELKVEGSLAVAS